MTLNTSSRSAKATPKRAPKQASNGTPTKITEPESGTISADITVEPEPVGMTEWRVETSRGKTLRVRVLGTNGRVSYGGSPRGDGHEVRFYRSQTAKHYDAVIPGVTTIYNTNVDIAEIGKTPELVEEEERYAKLHKERFDAAIEAVLKGRKVEVEDEEPAWGPIVAASYR